MFNPSLPATNSPNSSAEMRGQLTALDADIQQRATQSELGAAIAGTSSNTNGVAILAQSADGSYNQQQMQDALNKIDEFINAARR